MRLNLNVYGSRFTFGLQGDGATPIAPEALIELAADRGFNGIELPAVLVRESTDAGLAAVRAAAARRDLTIVLSTYGTQTDRLVRDAEIAAALGAQTMVTALENTQFGGDRRPHAGRWRELMQGVTDRLAAAATQFAALGVRVGVENHQDVDSRDLRRLCDEIANDHLGITFDTANGLGVAEHPVEFLHAVLPYVVYVHLKDYRVTWTREGYQLLRCATGAGMVPYADLLPILRSAGKLDHASVEVGALVPRVVRVFTQDFWSEYEPRPAHEVSRLFELLSTAAEPELRAFKTPFELGASRDDIVRFEERELGESLANARHLTGT